jgi:hypothetical protein
LNMMAATEVIFKYNFGSIKKYELEPRKGLADAGRA